MKVEPILYQVEFYTMYRSLPVLIRKSSWLHFNHFWIDLLGDEYCLLQTDIPNKKGNK